MNNSGFSSAKEKSQKMAAILRDVSLLIGEKGDKPIPLETGGTRIPGLGFISDAHALAQQAHNIEQGIFNMIVLGEFKNGKSTLLNSMLGSKTLPSKATPCTAIITILVSGDSDRVTLYESDRDTPRTLTWNEFKKEFQLTKEDQEKLDKEGYIDRFSNVEYALIECQNRLCNNGVRLIDSPGLKENASRTKVTTKFLKQSQSIIFVLNATKILSEDERDFIETFFQAGQINNVFFVINRINLIDREEVQEIKDFVKAGLKPLFVNERGEFDEVFYNRRVFFVDAKGALDARMGTEDSRILERSGVLELERELENFLASPDKITAAFSSTVQLLSLVVAQSREKINVEKSSLDQPLQELEKRRQATERMLKELEFDKKEIERTILTYGGMIKQKVYANLMGYVNEMKDTWQQDSKRLINLSEIGLGSLFTAAFRKKSKQKIIAVINRESKNYLQIKIEQWSQRVPMIIQEDIQNMMMEVEGQVEEFQLQLDKINTIFSSGNAEDTISLEEKKAQKMIQLVLSLGDPSAMTGSILGKGDWGSFFGRFLQQIIVVIVIESLFAFSNPIGLVIYLVIESFLIKGQADKVKEQILDKLGEKLHETLQKELPNKQDEIYKGIDKQFNQWSEQITKNLQQQIEEADAQQRKIIEQKKSTTFSVHKEQSRLNALGNKLTELFNEASMVTYGRLLTPEEINKMAESKKIMASS